MAKRRVVVTGMGMVSPLGSSVPTTWKRLLAGESGVGLIQHFDASDFSAKICATVKDFNPADHVPLKDLKKMDLFTVYGLAATAEALQDANLTIDEDNRARIGVAVGSGIGGIETILANQQKLLDGGPRRVSPFFIPAAIINLVAGHISIRHGLCGPNISIVTACTTGTHNLGHAARMIACGDADVMVAGGAEKGNNALCIAGFAALRALSTRNDEPERASRPWDKDRDGFVLGEGAGILVLEEYEFAKRRGARIYAEVVGFGMSADAYHMTAPDETGRGFIAAMENALKDARLNPEAIDYINAHGTSTPTGDPLEALAIKQTFKEHAYRLAVSSTKSMIGHLLGAAGAVEAIFSILAIRDQILPPTINLDNPEEECDLNFVPNQAQTRVVNTVLSNSFGFGGTNGTLIFSKI